MPTTPPRSRDGADHLVGEVARAGAERPAVAVTGDEGPGGDPADVGEGLVGGVGHVHQHVLVLAGRHQVGALGGEPATLAEDRAAEGVVAPGQGEESHARAVEEGQVVHVAQQRVGALQAGDDRGPRPAVRRRSGRPRSAAARELRTPAATSDAGQGEEEILRVLVAQPAHRVDLGQTRLELAPLYFSAPHPTGEDLGADAGGAQARAA